MHPAADDSGLQSSHRVAGLHPAVDGIAHDAAFEKASLRARRYNTPSPVTCSVMCVTTAGSPSALKARRTRSSWTGGPDLAFLPWPLRLPKVLHQPLSRQTTRWSAGHCLTSGAGFVEKQAVAELGIAAVRVEQGVGPVHPGQFAVGGRPVQPPVVGLAGSPSTPRHHPRHTSFSCSSNPGSVCGPRVTRPTHPKPLGHRTEGFSPQAAVASPRERGHPRGYPRAVTA